MTAQSNGLTEPSVIKILVRYKDLRKSLSLAINHVRAARAARVLSTFGCLFSDLFFINNKKTTTVNEKRKCYRPPYFNYLSNECLLTAKKCSRTKKSEKNDFAFLFNYKLIVILFLKIICYRPPFRCLLTNQKSSIASKLIL
jgi:hypothetical protein